MRCRSLVIVYLGADVDIFIRCSSWTCCMLVLGLWAWVQGTKGCLCGQRAFGFLSPMLGVFFFVSMPQSRSPVPITEQTQKYSDQIREFVDVHGIRTYCKCVRYIDRQRVWQRKMDEKDPRTTARYQSGSYTVPRWVPEKLSRVYVHRNPSSI